MEEIKISYILEWIRSSSSTIEMAWQFLIKINIHLPYKPTMPFWIFTLKKWKQCSHKNLYMNVYSNSVNKCPKLGTSLVAQWLRIRLSMQGTQVRALAQEDPTWRGATKPVHHNYWACALEPSSHNYWSCTPRAHAPQQEKPLQWEAHAPQRRVAPACTQQRRPNAAENK